MELLQIGYIKVISVLTSLCFISAMILKVFNILQINGYYLICFMIMFFLSITQLKSNDLNQTVLKTADMYLWASLFIWDILYIISIAFKLGRYCIKVI